MFLVLGLGALCAWIGLRFIYFGSIVRNCIYTEQTVSMKPSVATARVIFVGPAAIVSEVYAPYKCLPGFVSVENQIMQSKYKIRYDNGNVIDLKKITYVDEKSKIELRPVRLVAVNKHGITTIDSGGGPLIHLILKDSHGVHYQVPMVYLGINKGEEFLEMQKSDGTKELLSADSELSDR
jgi:hypothetical protein